MTGVRTPPRKRAGRSARKARVVESGFIWASPGAVAGAVLSACTEDKLRDQDRTLLAAQRRARAGASTYYLRGEGP